jgi:hypothetical protein
MFGDDVLGSVNIKMVEAARSVQVHWQRRCSGCAVPRWGFAGGASPQGMPGGLLCSTAGESCSLGADGCGAVKFISFLVER